jgi:PP-loop superfamily ATP-utilizing enzyme
VYGYRIPYGQTITREKLNQIGRAERYLQRLGLRQVRLRHHGRLARIEVQSGQLNLLLEPETCRRVVNFIKSWVFFMSPGYGGIPKGKPKQRNWRPDQKCKRKIFMIC